MTDLKDTVSWMISTDQEIAFLLNISNLKPTT